MPCVRADHEGRAQSRETWVFDRDGVEFDLEGGCADHDAVGLWLFVRARRGNKLPDTVELWFVDISAGQPSDRLQVVAEETVREAISMTGRVCGAMQPVEEGSPDEIGPVEYQLVATPDEVLFLRSHYLGRGRLQISAWEKETLRFGRTFSVDRGDAEGLRLVPEGDETAGSKPAYLPPGSRAAARRPRTPRRGPGSRRHGCGAPP